MLRPLLMPVDASVPRSLCQFNKVLGLRLPFGANNHPTLMLLSFTIFVQVSI